MQKRKKFNRNDFVEWDNAKEKKRLTGTILLNGTVQKRKKVNRNDFVEWDSAKEKKGSTGTILLSGTVQNETG